MAYGFVAGAYTATWNAITLGSTLQGFDIRPQHHRDDSRIDAMGDTVVDGVYRGYNISVSFQLSDWSTSGLEEALSLPYGGTPGLVANVGALFVAGGLAKTLALTHIVSGNDYSFTHAIPDFEHGAYSLNNHMRVMTCRFLILPDPTTNKFWT
jgi:hypothetical protein